MDFMPHYYQFILSQQLMEPIEVFYLLVLFRL